MRFTETLTEADYNLHLLFLNDVSKGKKLDLSSANLRSADLSFANLSFANFSSADLRSVDFSYADLSFAIGNNREVRSYQFGTYLTVMYLDKMSIGCQTHSLEDWWGFTDDQIARMDSKALDWWKEHKEILKRISEFKVQHKFN